MVTSQLATFHCGSRRRRIYAMFAAFLLALSMVVIGTPQSAHACQAYLNRAHSSPVGSGFYMGISVPKAPPGCTDVNISWTARSGQHRGQYRTSAGEWRFGAVGPVMLNAGTQNPWREVVHNVSTGASVRAGSIHSAANGGRSDWRV